MGKGGEKRREIVSGLGGRQGRVWWSEGRVCNACCVCSGKADPTANVANAGMCTGKLIGVSVDVATSENDICLEEINQMSRHVATFA